MLLMRPRLGYPAIYRLVPIQMAAARGLTSIVNELLLNDVSVDEGGGCNMPPLQFGICGGRFETAKFLIEKGALLKFAESNTAAHFAATSCSTDIMDYLVKGELDINASNILGDTPMCCALSSPFNIWKTMVPYLIQRGAQTQQPKHHEPLCSISNSTQPSILRIHNLSQLNQVHSTTEKFGKSSTESVEMLRSWTGSAGRSSRVATWNFFLHISVENIICLEIAKGNIEEAFEITPQLFQLVQIARQVRERWVRNHLPRSLIKLIDELVSSEFTLDCKGAQRLIYRIPFYFENLDAPDNLDETDSEPDSEPDMG
ncbi:hypothetical protein BGZ61DRAFT_485692 [Ilyonectria robusta]|uniref:uncharacterized protein n=1 Tax=Ilyonectria robusta TaxID=1079257 RepID=UPI001E8DF3B3|nr:uncharacterized protein BGZ61DRAFT_485692 [Ilyonectria robusta]KAH8659716.1 hypothetical protein BGZ61DRAFT_485692 [Ilyonectria robusta]